MNIRIYLKIIICSYSSPHCPMQVRVYLSICMYVLTYMCVCICSTDSVRMHVRVCVCVCVEEDTPDQLMHSGTSCKKRKTTKTVSVRTHHYTNARRRRIGPAPRGPRPVCLRSSFLLVDIYCFISENITYTIYYAYIPDTITNKFFCPQYTQRT